MYGIISLLDPTATARVEMLWDELETRCGLVGVKATPFPHFTWQVTEGYELEHFDTALKKFCSQAKPFFIHTDGLGIFTGENPVVYIPISKQPFLAELHTGLWQQTEAFTLQPTDLYSPSMWIPHITLAYNDVRRENLPCVMETLAFQSFEWEIRIDNLVYFCQDAGCITEMVRIPLGG